MPTLIRRLSLPLLLGVSAVALAVDAVPAQNTAPMVGGGRELRESRDSFPAVIVADDSGRATAYPTTRAGELLEVDRRSQRIVGLPDSVRLSGSVPVGVMVVREWRQVGTQTPRVFATRLRYAPEVQFRPFQTRLTIETAQAPDGELRLSVDGVRLGQYSNRARYAVVNELVTMPRPWVQMKLTVDDRVLWEGRFVAVPDRATRMRFIDGRVELVSP